MNRIQLLALGVALAITAGAGPAKDADKSARAADEAAIRASAAQFVKAFKKGDAKAIASLWTENGTLADEQGQMFKGRAAIEAEYAAFFKDHPGVRMDVAIQSIEFPAPTMAVEDGIARVVAKEGDPPVASRYTAIHLLQDGKWLMATVRESSIDLPSNYSHLRELDWLVGTWDSTGDGPTVHTKIRWIANRSFLEREYSVRENGVVVSSGTQIIGWDPQAEQIRSWTFDSSGGHGTGLWTGSPDGWRIETTGMLADGTPTSSRDLLIRVPDEDDVLGWRSTDRTVGTTELPDTGEVVLDRVQQKH